MFDVRADGPHALCESSFIYPLSGITKVEYDSDTKLCSVVDGTGQHEELMVDLSHRLAQKLLEQNPKARVAIHLTEVYRNLGASVPALAVQSNFGKLVGRKQARVSEVLGGVGTNPDRLKASTVLLQFVLLSKAKVSATELFEINDVEMSEFSASSFSSPIPKGKIASKPSPVFNSHYTRILECKWTQDGVPNVSQYHHRKRVQSRLRYGVLCQNSSSQWSLMSLRPLRWAKLPMSRLPSKRSARGVE